MLMDTNGNTKELLIKDLSSRLPYDVKVLYDNKVFSIDYVSSIYEEIKLDTRDNYTLDVSDVKPYLFPLSSMTEEQKMFLKQQDWCIAISTSGTVETTVEGIDWLNKNHFDYRGLIEKSLALDATNLGVYE